jgi:4-amino-4-deoxy-L-arabinose transferase-like glycosyltransferase
METSDRVPCADHRKRSAAFVCQRLLRGDAILVALLLALGIFSYWPNPTVADHVHADMWAYALPALNFLQGEGFVVIANGHKYPPVPTFGFPLLLSAAYATLGPHPGNGVYVVFLLGLVTIVLTYRIARMLFDGKVAVVACVLLAVAGQFRYYTKVIAPDGAVSASFCLASQVLLIAALRTPQSSLWTWALLGQTAGFAMTPACGGAESKQSHAMRK